MPVSKMRKMHPQERARRNKLTVTEKMVEWKKTREGMRQMKKFITPRTSIISLAKRRGKSLTTAAEIIRK